MLLASLAVTAKGLLNRVPIGANCGVVPVFEPMETAAPGRFVSLNWTEASPADSAITKYGPPAELFAVMTVNATPEALVVTPMVADLLEKRPETPEVGALKVRVTPGTGLPLASVTVTAKAYVNAALTTELCDVAAKLGVIAAADPGKLVIFLKLNGSWPLTVAVTA